MESNGTTVTLTAGMLGRPVEGEFEAYLKSVNVATAPEQPPTVTVQFVVTGEQAVEVAANLARMGRQKVHLTVSGSAEQLPLWRE